MAKIDKRLELLEALVIAVKQLNNNNIELNDELDFVEYYNIPYVKELIKKINIDKYPDIIEYITDIADCGYYTNLFLYFDNEFNLNPNFNFKPFRKKDTMKFGNLVKQIYEQENIESVFKKYCDFFSQLETEYQKQINIDFKKQLKKVYLNVDNIDFLVIISLLINGGFSATNQKIVAYVKGIKLNCKFKLDFNEYDIVCLFHEYSHYFVNQIVDKYYNEINNIDLLFNESVKNGLPKTYQNKKTVLYEYFVRALSLILSYNLISKKEYDADIEWFKEIGFIRVEGLIKVIQNGIKSNLMFDEIFKTLILDYLNNLKL